MSQVEIVWNNPPENNEPFTQYVKRLNIDERSATKYTLLFHNAVRQGKLAKAKFVYIDGKVDVDSLDCSMRLKLEIKKWLEIQEEILTKPPRPGSLRKYCSELSTYHMKGRDLVLKKLLIKHFNVIISGEIIKLESIQITDYIVPTTWIFGPNS